LSKLYFILKIYKKYLNIFYNIFGSRNYNKYVIIARSRTGSNLLNSYLNQSTQVIAKSEVFGRVKNKSEQKLWNNTFKKYAPHIKWVGFKIFYKHPVDSDSKFVWSKISRDKNIKIIHLTRNNKVRAELSKLIAFKTKKWAANTSKSDFKIPSLKEKKISVDVELFLKEIQSVVENEDYIRNKFSNHKIIEITYEQLSNKPEDTLKKIAENFNIKKFKIETPLVKQNTEDIADLVTNYNELEQKLLGTQFYSNLSES